MARLARVVVPGLPHHVTQRGNGGARTFFGDEDYAFYRDLLARRLETLGHRVETAIDGAHALALLAGSKEAREKAVLTSCAAKARIVAADERETGQRALLNLGHTFAHALEAEGGYGEALQHGEAVSIEIRRQPRRRGRQTRRLLTA